MEEKEILLIKGPLRGWEMPGGIVEEGKSVKERAIREIKEETGIDVVITKFCGIFQNVEKSICNIFFLAKQIGGQCTTSSESLKVNYYPIEEALKMVSKENFRERIRYCLDESNHPFYVDFDVFE